MSETRIQSGNSGAETEAARFLRCAQQCRARDLKQLSVLCELVCGVCELIHGLQKERGVSSIFLGSRGRQFGNRLTVRITECRDLQQQVCAQLSQLDAKLERLSSGARFYSRVAQIFHSFELLRTTREQTALLALTPQGAVQAYSEIIASLLAVIFEITDIATDATIARALVALVNFSQGKEYAGQERATAAAAFSRGRLEGDEHGRLQRLIVAQEQAFKIFGEFATAAQVEAYRHLCTAAEAAEVRRMRAIALSDGPTGHLASVGAELWYEQTTRRIDAMRVIEGRIASDLDLLCTEQLALARAGASHEIGGALTRAPLAMLVTPVDSVGVSRGLEPGVGLYGVEGSRSTPVRPILAVIEAQSRQIEEVSSQLESARTALTERKVIERAKGLLMKARRLSEDDAYGQIREAAMRQNKRIIEVAESIVSMAELLQV